MQHSKEWSNLVDQGWLNGTTPEARKRYCKVIRYLKDVNREGLTIDVGCGTGTCLKSLQLMGFSRLVGVEITESHVREARKNFPGAAYLVADGSYLPFRDGVFDVLVSTGSIEHYLSPDRGLKEFTRVSRKEMVVSSDCYVWRILQILGLYRSVQPVDRAMFPTRFFRMFKANKLDVVHYDGWGLTHYWRFFRKLGRAFRRIVLRSPASPRPPEAGEMRLNDRDMRIGRSIWPINYIKLLLLDENVFYLRKGSD